MPLDSRLDGGGTVAACKSGLGSGLMGAMPLCVRGHFALTLEQQPEDRDVPPCPPQAPSSAVAGAAHKDPVAPRIPATATMSVRVRSASEPKTVDEAWAGAVLGRTSAARMSRHPIILWKLCDPRSMPHRAYGCTPGVPIASAMAEAEVGGATPCASFRSAEKCDYPVLALGRAVQGL